MMFRKIISLAVMLLASAPASALDAKCSACGAIMVRRNAE